MEGAASLPPFPHLSHFPSVLRPGRKASDYNSQQAARGEPRPEPTWSGLPRGVRGRGFLLLPPLLCCCLSPSAAPPPWAQETKPSSGSGSESRSSRGWRLERGGVGGGGGVGLEAEG